jgi:gamma-glutamyltranspeptidase/glutathione hydrolase
MRLSRLACFLAVPALAAPFLLAACGGVGSTLGLSDSAPAASRSTALAVADEPLAAKTGAFILNQGGSAADAATAMFFTMTATYPVAAGLGGGGICLVHVPGRPVQEFDFLAHRANANGAFAVPGAARGFYDLQKAYGTLPWQRDVAGGEAYAATGFPISAALARRIAASAALLRQDPALAAEFLDTAGRPKPEGSVVTNVALSQSLSTVRLNGADGFYLGPLGAQITAAAGLQPSELPGTRTQIAAAQMARFGAYSVALPGRQTGAGTFAAALLANMSRAAGSQSADAAAVAAVRQTLASFGIASLPQDMGATGFAALDSSGQAVSCAVTLNGPFGAGRSAGSTGVTLASSPVGAFGYSTAFLTPLLANDSSGQVALAGVGAGGPNGSAAVQYALLKLASGQSIGREADLRSTGAAPFATVNAISCQSEFCVALTDPGGNGLGAAAIDTASAQ